MSYNDVHFDSALNAKLKDRLSNLQQWQDYVIEYLAQYLVASSSQAQTIGCDAFLQLLAKIRFNLDSTNVLLPKMYEDYRYKTSINVLYRAMVDDIINSYYLWGTVVINDINQYALRNELNILHKEFIMSVIEGITSEQQFRTFLDTLNNTTPSPVTNVEEEFKKGNPELIDQKGDWKKNSEIRATTHTNILKLLNQKNNSAFISEKKKLEFLKARGVPWHDELMSLFKYLSQYQHFSPRAHDLLNSHIDQDITIYQHTLGQLLMLLHELFPILKLNNKEELDTHLKLLGEKMINSFDSEL